MEIANIYGETALHIAAARGHLPSVKVWLCIPYQNVCISSSIFLTDRALLTLPPKSKVKSNNFHDIGLNIYVC